jgi:hypothetical protein
VSGFNNSATGNGAGNILGFFNTASGGSNINGFMSGFFNTGVTGPFPPLASGVVSGLDSGFFNSGTCLAGFFGITQRLKNLG